MDEPDFNIDDEVENEGMYQQEYMAYEEQLLAEEEYDHLITPTSPITPAASSCDDKIVESPLEVLNNEHSPKRKSTPRKIFPSPHLINRHHTRGPQVQSLFSGGLITQAEAVKKVNGSPHVRDRPPLGGDCMCITLEDGSRKYILRRQIDSTSLSNTTSEHQHLLSKSIQEVAAEAEAHKIARLASLRAEDVSKPSATVLSSQQSSGSKELWVDKYSPRGFSQLLSPEMTNREVLRAIKMWDKFVFDREPPPAASVFHPTAKTGNPVENTSEQDKHDLRPEHKVILLTGPPGTGKTTLAHVVATHCGYRAVELNASDDRSAEAIRDVLSRSMGSYTLDGMGTGEKGENRPNCVILDEIDGVDGRAPIDALLAIIRAPLQPAGNVASKKKRKKGSFAVTRPIICICNDPFAPMLRELRGQAKVFAFNPPSETRLVQRLKHVCAAEGLQHVNPQALSALCQAAGGDIRSAINTLQFAALRCQSKVAGKSPQADPSYAFSRALSQMLISGLKDERQDIFELWRRVFCSKYTGCALDTARRAAALPGAPYDEKDETDVNSVRTIRPNHAMQIFESVAGYGDNQLVMMGLFDNYLAVRFTDPTFQRTWAAADWLSFGDVLEGKLYSGDAGSHSVSGYVPCVASVLHLVCATDTRMQKISYPVKDRNVRFAKQQQANILAQFYEGSVLRSPTAGSKQMCVMDVIPYLMDSMSLSGAVKVRAGPMQMLSAAEKTRVQDVAKTMVAFGLKYERQSAPAHNSTYPKFRSQEGIFQLDPCIHLIVKFRDNPDTEKRRAPAPSELLHNLYLEVRSMVLKAQLGVEGVQDTSGDMEEVVEEGQTYSGGKRGVDKVLSRVNIDPEEEGPQKKTKMASGGFAGFFTKVKSSKLCATTMDTLGSSATAPKIKAMKTTVHFKFNQGFSNAVKRPVKMKEFLR